MEFVDPEKMGVWGLSCGGYLTLQAIIRNPEMFRAAIDVAGGAVARRTGISKGYAVGLNSVQFRERWIKKKFLG